MAVYAVKNLAPAASLVSLQPLGGRNLIFIVSGGSVELNCCAENTNIHLVVVGRITRITGGSRRNSAKPMNCTGAGPGSHLRVRAPNTGQEMTVIVPAGVGADAAS